MSLDICVEIEKKAYIFHLGWIAQTGIAHLLPPSVGIFACVHKLGFQG